MKIWCVKDRHGVWHATEDGNEPSSTATSTRTRCGMAMTLVVDQYKAQQEPTCPACVAEISKDTGDET